jgi:hypothetical protein
VHARLLHARHGGDGAHQLALHGVLVAGVFHEAADAEARLLAEHFKPAAGTLGQALGRELHARLVHGGGRHAHGAGGGVEPVRDGGLLQRRHHLRRVPLLEAAVQQAVVWRACPQHDADDARDTGGERHQQHRLARRRQLDEALDQRRRTAGGRSWSRFGHGRSVPAESAFKSACS